jgi:hypothetical protein
MKRPQAVPGGESGFPAPGSRVRVQNDTDSSSGRPSDRGLTPYGRGRRGNGGGSREAAMDRLFSRKHRRYLQILADPRDEVQRRIILKLLAEEEAALRETPSEGPLK